MLEKRGEVSPPPETPGKQQQHVHMWSMRWTHLLHLVLKHVWVIIHLPCAAWDEPICYLVLKHVWAVIHLPCDAWDEPICCLVLKHVWAVIHLPCAAWDEPICYLMLKLIDTCKCYCHHFVWQKSLLLTVAVWIVLSQHDHKPYMHLR